MKRLKIMFVSMLAMLALSFAFIPTITAGADEVSEMPENSAIICAESLESVESVETPAESEGVENSGDYMASYYAQTSETDGVRLDFIDESNVKCVMFVEGVEVGTLNATYQRVDNIVDIYVLDEWFGAFKLNGDGTASDVSWWEDYYEDPEESVGNTGVLDEDTQDGELTLDELSQIVADYLASKKTANGGFDFWAVFKDLKTWVIAGMGALVAIGLTAIFAAIIGHFKNKGVINTEKNVEQIAAKAATEAVQGLVGSSINLDVSAAVNKAVETFMYGIKNELDVTFDMTKNVEILSAEIAQALAKSRVLTKEEQEHLKEDASAVMAHAQKCGVTIKAPATVVVKETPKTPENSTVIQKHEEKPENGYTLNFGGV